MKANFKQIFTTTERYLSEIADFKDGLPHGVLLKRATDVGGTFVTLNCSSNYIIVAPFIDLVDSIVADKNSPYSVFAVYGGVKYSDFKEYINNNKTHKIAVTYNSLEKLIEWLDKMSVDYSGYKVLIDEYQLILEDMGFRSDCIESMMSQVQKFNHYTFMSATPINDSFSPECISSLLHTEVVWYNQRVIKPTRIKTYNVFKAAVELIKEFKKGLYLEVNGVSTKVEELYFFVNSVKGIKEIIKSCDLSNEEVKVVCADGIRNKQVMEEIEISKAIDPNSTYNFFTKKGFQGCNLFTNNGLTVVLSDSKRSHTLVDVETTLFQIAGRHRTNNQYDNIFKDRIWHIFSTRKVNYAEEKNNFDTLLEVLKKETLSVMEIYNKLSGAEREVFSKRIDIDDLMCYYDRGCDCYKYSELKEKFLQYNFNLSKHVYQSGLTIRDSYSKAKLDVTDKQKYVNSSDETVIAKITTVSFKTLLQQYIELRETDGDLDIIKNYELEFPLFKEAYDKLGAAGINTCSFVEKNIKEKLYAKSDSLQEVVFRNFYKAVGENTFITNADAKDKLKSILEQLKVKESAKLSQLSNCKWFQVVEMSKRFGDKVVKGILLKKIK